MSAGKLKEFVQEATRVMDTVTGDKARMLATRPVLEKLIRQDDWLPDAFARPHPEYYQQYLLYCDPHERFCIVSFVWGPGQKTPVHDHGVWGLVGMLRGSETSQRFEARDGGLHAGETATLEPGQIECLLPEEGDIHQVRNRFDDKVSISVHVYGANIGKVRRRVLDPATGQSKEFISGFSSDVLPNIWR
ncbi:cysteine dioxygenase family protein [Achromobacter aloeverae]|uniref:Cysteine dioxygenase n=1 Tax=Achromobacter aloeverae TaxID=1750518 RepID=A0A4Q1HHZ1_9BURK|nr:cysteine dioxygenase [Achromobacter aloeverae]RXN87824.1 cysteine dioxygenase [Achromobacter aloeverae]